MPAKTHFAFTEFREIFHQIMHTRDRILEADPNVKRSRTVHQGIVKILIPYYKKKEVDGWLAQLSVQCLLSAQVIISGVRDQAPHRAPGQALPLALCTGVESA